MTVYGPLLKNERTYEVFKNTNTIIFLKTLKSQIIKKTMFLDFRSSLQK